MASTLNTTAKSRDLSPLEYLEMLQLEFVVAELRRRIYSKPKDKAYYMQVMENKRVRIENIARRNAGLKTIFTSEEVLDATHAAVYPKGGGLPKFYYKNETQREELEPRDFAAYFMPNQEVQVFDEHGESSIGLLTSVNAETKIAIVRIKGKKLTPVSTNNISRIL